MHPGFEKLLPSLVQHRGGRLVWTEAFGPGAHELVPRPSPNGQRRPDLGPRQGFLRGAKAPRNW